MYTQILIFVLLKNLLETKFYQTILISLIYLINNKKMTYYLKIRIIKKNSFN